MTSINTQSPRSGDSTPSLIDTIETVIRRNILDLNFSMPGMIISYNSENQRAVVQPLFDNIFADGSRDQLQPISNVPVQFPRSRDSFIHVPVDGGTPCLLIFSQRALDAWKASSGSCVDPRFGRILDLTDAIAIPGVSPNLDTLKMDNPKDITIKNKDANLRLAPDGKISISNSSEELIQILIDLVLSLRNSRTATAAGPQPLIDGADPMFTNLEQRLMTFLAV